MSTSQLHCSYTNQGRAANEVHILHVRAGAAHGHDPEPLASDAAALNFAAEKRAALILSASAFVALAQTAPPNYPSGWEIPITVLPASRCSSPFLSCAHA